MSAFAAAVDSWALVMLAVTWQLAALAALAWLCERLFRLRQARVRHVLWWFVLLAPLVLAPGRIALQSRQAVIAVPAPAAVTRVVPLELPPRATLEPVALPVVPYRAPLTPLVARTAHLRLADVLATAWLLGCAALAVRLFVGHRRVRRLLGESRLVSDGRAREVLLALCAQAGVRGEVTLRASGAIGSPVLCGWRRPVIVMPADWLDALTEDELRAMLAHEVAHVRRRDFLANTIQRLVGIPLFYHPGAWLASRRIVLAREQVCDAWALMLGTDAASYARCLTAAAERAQAALAPVSLGIAESRFTLLRRVEAIMGGGGLKRLSRPLAISLVAVALVSAAAFAAVKVTGEPRRESARHAEASAASPAERAAAAPVTRTVIRGLLKAPDGRPAAGVTIHMEGDFEPRRPETDSSQGTVTGKDGRFELVLSGPGKRSVWVFDERFYAILARDVESRTGGTLTLPPVTLQKSPRIRGRVLNAVGDKPLSGIRVISKPILKSGVIPSGVHVEATSGTDGEFVVAAPPGTAWLQAIGASGYTWSHVVEETTMLGRPGLYARSDPDKPTDRTMQMRPGQSLTGVDLFLEPAASVEGIALGPDGKRWEHGGYVCATEEVDRVISEMYVFGLAELPADGTFRIGDLPSEVPIAVWMEDEERGLGGAALVTTSAERTPRVTLGLSPLATLRGRVVRMDGSRVAGAELEVEGTRRQLYLNKRPVQMRSRADGSFETVAGIAGMPLRVRAAFPPTQPGGPYAEYFGESELFSVTSGQTLVDLGDIVITKPVHSGRASGSSGRGPVGDARALSSGPAAAAQAPALVYDSIALKYYSAGYILYLFGAAEYPAVPGIPGLWPVPRPATNGRPITGGTRFTALLPEGIKFIGAVSYESQQLLVAGTPEAVAQLRELIQLMDRKPQQMILTIMVHEGAPENGIPAYMSAVEGDMTVVSPRKGDAEFRFAGEVLDAIRVATMNLVPASMVGTVTTTPGRPRQQLIVVVPRINADGSITLHLRYVAPSDSHDPKAAIAEGPGMQCIVNVPDGETIGILISRDGVTSTLTITPRIVRE